MKNSPKIVGLVQALGIAAYIGFFALSVRVLLPIFDARFPDPGPTFLPMILFLLTFVTSALICVSIVFAYPTRLFFQEKKESAFHIVLWTMLWLIVMLAVVLLSAIMR